MRKTTVILEINLSLNGKEHKEKNMTSKFNYELAYSRNIGWLSESEQQTLRNKKVAIAGLGGVGGAHATTLSRLGIGKFSLSDFDTFEVENFNRQHGAKMSTLGQKKLDTVASMVKDINPEIELNLFPEGINDNNIDAFLHGVDLYCDSLDFFATEIRRSIFKRCAELNIPAITAAPLGMGTAFLYFKPGQMNFEEYFGMNGCSEEEQFIRFYIGLSPAQLHSSALVVPESFDPKRKKGPSTIMGCELCAGVAATFALKILLNRGPVPAVPTGIQFDAYTNRMKKTWRPFGHKNPIFRLTLKKAKAILGVN